MSVLNIDYDSVRYTQEHLYSTFSHGKMSVSETYVALANGLIDPTGVSPMTIFEYNDRLYCIDTRRLTIAKELQRKGKFNVLKKFPFKFAKKGDENFDNQYADLINNRLPAMKKKGLNGSTIKLQVERDHQCCYDLDAGRFRVDLEEHIAKDHLLKMSVRDFKDLNVNHCNQCKQKCQISMHGPSNRSMYRFIQNCDCPSKVLREIKKPWTEFTLQNICDEFLSLKGTHLVEHASLKSSPITNEPKRLSNDFKEKQTDGSTKWFYLFLMIFIGILSWLLFILNQHKGF